MGEIAQRSTIRLMNGRIYGLKTINAELQKRHRIAMVIRCVHSRAILESNRLLIL